MKNLLFLALVISSIVFSQNTTDDLKVAANKNNKLLKELVDKHKAVGAVAGISQGDSVLWEAAYGHMDLKNSTKANLEMKTRIASIAKPMTALAVMQLFEQGLIALEDPIQNYIIEFPSMGNNKITVRQLLNHSSGIKGYANVKEAQNTKNYPTLTDAMNVFKDRALSFEPGDEYAYTSFGYVVLGVLIERVSGLTFEEYMMKNIWGKAGMKNTGIEQYGASYENKSALYSKNKKGKVKDSKKGNNLSNRIPGGGFYSTLGDMLKFGQAVLNNSLIKAETFSLMLKNHGPKKEGNPYGLGWVLYGAKPSPENVIGHGGAQTGASTDLIIIPSKQQVIVVLANTSRVGETIGTAVGILRNYKKEE